MIGARLSVREQNADPHVEGAVAADLLWIFARPEDCLEHIHSQSVDGNLEVTFFIRSKTFSAAQQAAVAICRRALLGAPALRGWQLIEAADPTAVHPRPLGELS